MNFENIIKKEILELHSYEAGKKINKINTKSIKLSSNENPYGTDPFVISELNNEIKKGFSIYPDSKMIALKEKIVNYWNHNNIKNITTNNILLGNGSGECINMIFSLLINNNDEVIIPEKSFSLYKLLSIPKGAKIIETKRKNDFSISLDDILTKITNKTKIIIFSNPDNPTSTFKTKDEIERFVRSIPENIIIVIDEAYIHFADINNTSLYLFNKYKNLIFLYTFSKAFALASMRIGYAIMDEFLAINAEKIRLPFNLGNLQQLAAIKSLENLNYVNDSVLKIINTRQKFCEFLKTKNITYAIPKGNFVFVDLKDKADIIYSSLENEGISIRNLSSFGWDSSYARITIGKDDEMELLMKIINKII